MTGYPLLQSQHVSSGRGRFSPQHGWVGPDKWKNVVLVGTKADRATHEELELFRTEVQAQFFAEAPGATGTYVQTSKDDYSQLYDAIAVLPHWMEALDRRIGNSSIGSQGWLIVLKLLVQESWTPSKHKNRTGNPKKGQHSVFVFKVLGISVQGKVVGRPNASFWRPRSMKNWSKSIQIQLELKDP
jgi:hypothetical protein